MITNKSRIARAQCERTAREYYAFRKKGDTANDLVEIPAMKKLLGDINNKKILDAGFLIDRILEPVPDPSLKALNSELFKRASQHPIFVIFCAERI